MATTAFSNIRPDTLWTNSAKRGTKTLIGLVNP